MNKNTSQSGFGIIEIPLIIAILAIVGLIGGLVYGGSGEVAGSSTVASTIPQGWKKYENKDLGFSFAYPEKWGEVKVSNGQAPYEGGHYLFTFSKFDQFRVASKSADYKYTGPGMGAPPIDGFTDFNVKYQDILKHERKIEGHNGEVLKKAANYIVYTYAEGSQGTIITSGIAKTKKLPGLEFGLTADLAQFKLTEDVQAKLYSGEISAKQYQTWNQLDTVILFAKNVKSL